MQLPNPPTQPSDMSTQSSSFAIGFSGSAGGPNVGSGPTHAPMAVDTNDPGHLPNTNNLSSTGPPLPGNMVEPPRTPRTYIVYTAGDHIGIADGRRPITPVISSLPYFSMRKFTDWDSAHAYYTERFNTGEIHWRSTTENHPLAPGIPAPGLAPSIPAPGPISSAPPTVSGAAAPGPIPPAGASSVPVVAAPALIPVVNSAPTGTSATATVPSESSASPLGHEKNPICVTSAFPTPVLCSKKKGKSVAPDEHPLALDKALPLSSRLRGTIRAARFSPTSGRSKSSTSKKVSSAATRIVRYSKGKGISMDSNGKLNPHLYVRAHPKPLLIVHGESDDDTVPGPSYPKAKSSTELDLPADAFVPTTLPSITLTTPSTPAPAVVIPATAMVPTVLQTPPNRMQRLASNQAGFSPSAAPSDTDEEYNRLVQSASKTPRSAGSERRLAMIKEALAMTETPLPTPSPFSPATRAYQRRLIVENVFANSPSPPSFSLTPTRARTPQAGPSTVCSVITPTRAHTPEAGPSTIRSVVPAAHPANPTSPETDYGLDSDMEPGFLEEASVFLDQGYTRN